MTITRLDSGPRMSEAVIHGNTVYLAGQIAEGATVTDQMHGVFAEIEAMLAKAGTDKSKLLTAMVVLADIADFAEMNAAWDKWIDGKDAPTRATIEAKLAAPQYKVEIIVTAARD